MANKKTPAKRSIDPGKTAADGKPTVLYTNIGKEKKAMLHEAPAVYQSLYTSPISLLNSSKKGLDAKAALDFLNLSGFTQEQFQETFNTSVKTIQNYHRDELKLDAALSEKLLKSFALFEKGIEIFGSAGNFSNWLYQPAFGLGNQIPFDMMDTITGIGLIEEELVRIAYGDLA